METRAVIRFFAAYLSVTLAIAWGVAEASPWIASHILMKWML